MCVCKYVCMYKEYSKNDHEIHDLFYLFVEAHHLIKIFLCICLVTINTYRTLILYWMQIKLLQVLLPEST